MPGRLRSYHFDVGNSTDGPVGFCARIKAYSRKEALATLQMSLPAFLEAMTDQGNVEYLTVYFNPDAITIKDIDDVEDD